MPHDHVHAHDAHHGHSHENPAGKRRTGHDHHHIPQVRGSEGRIAMAAGLTGAFMLVEVAGGIFAGSLALIADAGHMLSDFASLSLAWFAARIARRPPDSRRTYGFSRFSVLAAFVNGLTLMGIAVWITVEAIRRAASPGEVLSGPMLWIAIGGLGVNVIAFVVLHGADQSSLNVRGAVLHVIGDILGSVAAIAAAVIIMFTDFTLADPILSALIALLILRSAWPLVKESGHILLEGAPDHLEIDAIVSDLESSIDGVLGVHHAHAWSLDGSMSIMTMHAKISDTTFAPAIVAGIKERLISHHGVAHATVEIEYDECAGGDGCLPTAST